MKSLARRLENKKSAPREKILKTFLPRAPYNIPTACKGNGRRSESNLLDCPSVVSRLNSFHNHNHVQLIQEEETQTFARVLLGAEIIDDLGKSIGHIDFSSVGRAKRDNKLCGSSCSSLNNQRLTAEDQTAVAIKKLTSIIF